MVPVLTDRRRAEFLVGAFAWLVALVNFWVWWLEPDHYVGLFGFLSVTVVLAWVTLLPAYFMVIFYRSRRPNGPLKLPVGSRVAMVVTKAPSEPFLIVAVTLNA
ncbi:MAG: N-acetylglucosaminyltransferase, partial [Mesorhizobium sp.]